MGSDSRDTAVTRVRKIMQKIKSLLGENEEIIWSDRAVRNTIKENFLRNEKWILFLFFNGLILLIPLFLFLNEPTVPLIPIILATFIILYYIFIVIGSVFNFIIRKIENIEYIISSKNIYIKTLIQIKKDRLRDDLYYVNDKFCSLLIFKHAIKNNIAIIPLEQFNRVEIKYYKDNRYYNIYFGVNSVHKIKLAGINSPSLLIDFITKKLNYSRKYKNIECETYMKREN